jgi:hypothetical protein
MERIARDRRHDGLEVVGREPTGARRFSGWSMALADWPEEDGETAAEWFQLLEEFRLGRGRFGAAAHVVDFALSLAARGYLA